MRRIGAMALVSLCIGCAKPAPPLINAVAPAPGLPLVVIDPTRPGLDARTMPPAADVAAAKRPVKVSEKVTRTLIERRPVHIGYPAQAKAKQLAGHVTFRAIVSKDGTVQGLSPVEVSDPIFLRAATAYAQSLQYHPYLLNGQPSWVDTSITVNFNPADVQ